MGDPERRALPSLGSRARVTGRAAARNPIKDQVAVIGLGSTGYTRHAAGRTQSSLAL